MAESSIQKALWYVESHSRGDLSLEDIARVCGVSPYHLTRGFAGALGLSLMRYVRSRRLSEAARQLAAGADNILNLALEAGYSSHEAFTRAFRDLFGLTPEQVRSQGHVTNIHLTEAIYMSSPQATRLNQPRFVQAEAMLLAGHVQRYDCRKPERMPDQWQGFVPYIGNLNGQIGDEAYGVVYNLDADGFMDYMCAVRVRESTELPNGFERLHIPALRFVVFRHEGHIATIRSTLAAVWNEWFPESGFESAEGPTLERYGPEFDGRTGLGGVEIWIPVRRP